MTQPELKRLIQKVRYALKKEGQALVVPRGCNQLGIYVVDKSTNAIVAHQCSIEGLAEQLGII